MSSISDSQKIELLYKKLLGVGNTKPTGIVSVEPGTSALPTVIPSLQVFSQDIPTSAPIDLILVKKSYQVLGRLERRMVYLVKKLVKTV